MKLKKIMILALLILTLYVGTVSAANDTAVEPALGGIDDSNTVEISNVDNSKISSVEDKNSQDVENKLSSGVVHQFNGTTFSELRTEINNASSGDTIVLNNDIILQLTKRFVLKEIIILLMVRVNKFFIFILQIILYLTILHL